MLVCFCTCRLQIEAMSSNECFGCGRTGHWIKNCPNAGRGRSKGRGRGKGERAGDWPSSAEALRVTVVCLVFRLTLVL